ncbi:MAG: peroxiredoxin family protein [Deinococcus sp.]
MLIGGVLLAALVGGYLASTSKQQGSATKVSGTAQAGEFRYAVGTPGIGADAPLFTRSSTAGTNFNLDSLRGKNVLLYFQEGVGCQPCWDQLKDIEKEWPQFKAAGVDEMVTITVDPVSALKRKQQLEGLKTALLSDEGLAVSRMYGTNKYGMMSTSFDGHSFILVGADGKIRWRADYGGAPDYIMFVPVPNLLADMKRDLRAAKP